jgi:hypothetical protein
MSDLDLIPPAVSRRLIMNLLGFRLHDSVWVRDQLYLDQEYVDHMDPETWEASVTGWWQPGTQACERADGHKPMAENCPR